MTPRPSPSAAVLIAATVRARILGQALWPEGRLITLGEMTVLIEQLDRQASELARVRADNAHLREEKRLVWNAVLVPRARRIALEVFAWGAIALFWLASASIAWQAWVR